MDTNPYKHHDGAIEAQPVRGLSAISRFGWFLAGFVVACFLCIIAGYSLSRPLDITQSWPQDLREILPPDQEWMRETRAHKVGQFVVIMPADPRNASAMISAPGSNRFPQVMFHDDGPDGRFDSILVNDSDLRHIAIDVAGGKFKSYNDSTGLDKDSVVYDDANMDGQFDSRLGPGRHHAVVVNSEWSELLRDGQTAYVEVDGNRTPLKLVDGVWEIANSVPQHSP
jgi:hypothetical protein